VVLLDRDEFGLEWTEKSMGFAECVGGLWSCDDWFLFYSRLCCVVWRGYGGGCQHLTVELRVVVDRDATISEFQVRINKLP